MLAIISAIFLVTLLIGVPVAVALGLAGASYILFWSDFNSAIIVRRMYHSFDSFPLLAIPLFIILGHLSESSGLLSHLMRWLQVLVGRMKAGMAYINVLSSMIFAGVSGTAVSDVASLGRLELELMRQSGYEPRFSAALTAASSICGPIIPPSVAMVIYALAAGGNVSIGGLFLAGVLPGLLIGAGLLVISYIATRRMELVWVRSRMDYRQLVETTWRILPLLLLPLIIIGGIVGGVFTATESAVVGVFYVLVIGFLVTRELTLRKICEAIVYAAEMSGVLALLMGAGAVVSWILTVNNATAELASFIGAFAKEPQYFLAITAVTLLVLGCFMDATAIIICLAPLLAPLAVSLGISPLQFGLVFVLSTMIGLITPPVGVVLFMTSSISGVSIEGISRAIVPFLLWLIAVVALAIYLPAVTLWLPRMFGF